MRLGISLVIVGLVGACGSKESDKPATGSGAAGSGTASMPFTRVELVRCAAAPAPLGISPGRLGGGSGISSSASAGELAPPLDKVAIRIDVRALGAEPAIMKRYLKRQVPQIRSCYDEVATTKLAGAVALSFSLDSAGKVTDAKASGLDDKLATCIEGVVRAIAFPAPNAGEAEASTRIVFSYQAVDGFGMPVRKAKKPNKPSKPNRPNKPANKTAALKMTPELMSALGKLTDEPSFALPETWTPFARSSEIAAAPAAVAAAATEVIEQQLAELERCFASKHGSLRALIEIEPAGTVRSVRAGGVGDGTVEHCAGEVLKRAKFAPHPERRELACDFTRGDDAPWRLTTTHGYTLVRATKDGVQLDGKMIPVDAIANQPLANNQIAAVLASVDAESPTLIDAIELARDAPVTLVAVEDGTNAPVLVGVSPAHDRLFGRALELSSGGAALDLCLMGVMLKAAPPTTDSAAIAAAIGRARSTWCEATPCGVLAVIDEQIGARQLVTIAGAARAAGVDVLGLSDRKECGL